MGERIATVVWELPGRSAEHCALERAQPGYRLAGTVVLAVDAVPHLLEYAVRVDEEWRTRSVEVRSNGSDLELSSDGAGVWSVPDLDGCTDVDLAFTPATNTLPIRRGAPDVGGVLDLDAAWVRFPELTVERLSQRYERLADARYLYSSNDFRAELAVDGNALVLEYEGFWRALAIA